MSNASKVSSRHKKKVHYHLDELMLYAVDLTSDTEDVIETSVARSIGMMDMYRDLADATSPHHVEHKFSTLESRVGEVIS